VATWRACARCWPGHWRACSAACTYPIFRPYDGADAGFDPADHTEVDERLRSWADVQAMATDHAITVDVVVNHVSSSSPPFLDWLPFWAPGIPQVYYVGLLAGSDDIGLLARSNVGRDFNRHHCSRATSTAICAGRWSRR